VLFQKIKKFLISPKTVITLIIIILIACVIGFLIPQVTDKSPSYFELWKEKNPYTFRIVDRLQLNRVYTSIWFLSTIFLVMVSLGYSIYLQVRRNLFQHSSFTIHERGTNSDLRSIANKRYFAILKEKRGGVDIEKIKKIFRKKGYRLLLIHDKKTNSSEPLAINNKQKLVFIKNSIGRWGSIIFHFGMLLIIISALIAFSFQKRGFVQIIKGEIFSGKDTDFLSKNVGVFVRNFDLDFKTHFLSFKHEYGDNDILKALESSIAIIDRYGKIRRALLSINEPFDFNGVRIYQSNNYGYTLSFVLRKNSGEKVVTHFNLDMARKKGVPLIGKSDFPTTDYIFQIKFYPDITGQTFYITKPIVYLTISEAFSNNLLFKGLLLPKHSIKIKDDILTFAGITEWSGLIFAQNPGIIITYIGFIFGIVGALVIFGFPYKEVCLSVERGENETTLFVDAYTKRYQAIFKEEIGKIVNDIRQLSQSRE
jgi:cytochrome c biogenesis protein ResB